MHPFEQMILLFATNAVILTFSSIYRKSFNQGIMDSYSEVYEIGQRYGRCLMADSISNENHRFRLIDPNTNQLRFSFEQANFDQIGQKYTPNPFIDLANHCQIETKFPKPQLIEGDFYLVWLICAVASIAMITLFHISRRTSARDPWDLPIQGYDPKIKKTELETLLDQAETAGINIPNKFTCPISKLAVRRPVSFTQENIIYDASNISNWINQCKNERRPEKTPKTPTGTELNGYISLGRDRRFEQRFITYLKKELKKKDQTELKTSSTFGSKKFN